MFYKVVIETGHRRAEKNFQIIRYLKADNSVHLFDMLEGEPGMTIGELGYAITMVKAISRKEYEEGREEEKKNPVNLRVHVRFKIKKRCILKLIEGESDKNSLIYGETSDISAGGLGINYKGPNLAAGTRVKVTIDELQVSDKKAEIVWCFSRVEKVLAGLRWI
ncbi:MAG: PilZ domain-containing protein [Deltaproteobacteria bacterium]|nr:PilZ domain-containing protein [Deltaproteobacteria bacterium]